MLISSEVSGSSPEFSLTRSGDNVTASFFYGLSGYYDEETEIYLWNGEILSQIGDDTGSVFQMDDRPMYLDYTAALSDGVVESAYYDLNDYDDGTSIHFEFNVVLFSTAATFDGTAGTEVVFGSEFADRLNGYGGNDFFEAGDGDDYIDGGLGADTMQGGNGVDRYIVDNIGDIVDESTATTNDEDIVLSSISFSLANTNVVKGSVEIVQLLGTADLNILGNALANRLIGNSGANQINGGAGADWMQGRGGNDTYTVDNFGDVVDETLGGSNGIDTVRSAISFSLADAVHAKGAIENLTLVGTLGLNALGNSLNNVLTGNSGANQLNGGGGADLMRGGAGNDTYTVDNAGDVVDESVAGSGGIDTVRSTVSFSLGNAAQAKGLLENVTLLGAANANALGNSLGNVLIGNAGNNIVGGGNGNDTLTGGGGNDIFLINGALNSATNRDTITDMNEAGNDTIWLEDAVFTALSPGALAAGAFRIGAGAVDADDRIIYNSANGQLTYDANGSALGGATVFAVLDAGLALTAADFFVV